MVDWNNCHKHGWLQWAACMLYCFLSHIRVIKIWSVMWPDLSGTAKEGFVRKVSSLYMVLLAALDITKQIMTVFCFA